MQPFRGHQALRDRLQRSPGLPCRRSQPIVLDHCSEIPDYADFVVIGSGITGTSVARRLLQRCRKVGWDGVRVLMLEARDACSGATGRNGGHISPPLYHDWAALQEQYGEDYSTEGDKVPACTPPRNSGRSQKRRDILEVSEWRAVDSVDVYYDSRSFTNAKAKLSKYQAGFTFRSSHIIERSSLADDVAGCIAGGAGAIHPYRFVTGILSNLLARYPENFFLCTNTPCISVSSPSSSTSYYTVMMPQGQTHTPHVIHATNGWCSHLLEPMRTKIVPARGNMSAQRPGRSLPPTTVLHSYIFYAPSGGYDYLTQLPNGDRELMLGAAFTQSTYPNEVGNTDDSTYNTSIGARLGDALPRYFGEKNWGPEAQPTDRGDDDEHLGTEWIQGRTKAMWSGIIGASIDLMPWVGRLPRTVSAPGEWIAAGYTGEGMVHAWLSGKALAGMILGAEREDRLSEWFPDALRMTHARWQRATLEALAGGTSEE
ncbi:FAD dependent oxidoreductase [Pisolithus marmoratus]|nr:FAD dependent oxidoreductase [Pisolithus marmoratus]